MNRPNSGAPDTPDAPDASARSGDRGVDDTVDLRISGELAALIAEHDERGRLDGHARPADARPDAGARAGTDSYARLEPPADAASPQRAGSARDLRGEAPAAGPALPEPDLLDSVGDWPACETPVGTLRLLPVRMDRDLRLISAWMNDPAVAAYWELDGPQEVTAAHLRPQLEGDGRSVPCLGVLDGVPMSYWEIYRADLDPIARHCRARPHDTGIHLLIGGVPDRGRGIGTALLRAVADLVLDRRPSCGRVLAEPDVRNTASVAAFLSAGFRLSAEVDLPGKRAALMVRDRALRDVL
ncbi:GNAT family N-acetyltransferase [Streptomyces winkii]|uniref:GNAT family N-acetyltransferase n=1 Tax=Streptomyces winkii TaxID=3051178 RepID=UPI0028D088BE|nr:GNAT family N-acetyltransferase [Streptomyces sp. DSM 40971]